MPKWSPIIDIIKCSYQKSLSLTAIDIIYQAINEILVAAMLCSWVDHNYAGCMVKKKYYKNVYCGLYMDMYLNFTLPKLKS